MGKSTQDDEGYVELNADQRKAERIASLAALFMGAREPVSSRAIHSDFYPSLSDDSFTRTWGRDRIDLAYCGVIVTEGKGDGNYATWKIDEERSFARGVTLDPRQAAAFALACQPLLEDEGFPMRGELKFALGKIYNYFDTDAEDVVGGGASDKVSRELMLAIEAGNALQIDYVDRDGNRHQRLIAPYGTFSLRGHLYVVGPRLDEDGGVIADTIRTRRVDRIKKAKVTGLRFSVPADFDVSDYRKLPFQMGEAICEGHFLVPAASRAEVEHAGGRLGDADREGTSELVAGVADLTDAAAWAISVGARPTEPQELVDAWKAQLEGAMARG